MLLYIQRKVTIGTIPEFYRYDSRVAQGIWWFTEQVTVSAQSGNLWDKQNMNRIRLHQKQYINTEKRCYIFKAFINAVRSYIKDPYDRQYLLSKSGRVAQSVGHLTRKSGVLGSIPGLATYFRFSFRFFKKGSCQLLAKVCARSTG